MRSVLHPASAYAWGLRMNHPGPEIQWMLTPETISSPGGAPERTDAFTLGSSNPETLYANFVNFAGLYTSSDRHIDKTIDAICRAIVSLARFGFVPPSSNCW